MKIHIYKDELYPVYVLERGEYYNGTFLDVDVEAVKELCEEQDNINILWDNFQNKLKAIYKIQPKKVKHEDVSS